MQPELIKQRLSLLRLRQKELAVAAGLNPNTVGRILSEKNGGWNSTHRGIETALETEELRVARHLLSLPHIRAALAAEPTSEGA